MSEIRTSVVVTSDVSGLSAGRRQVVTDYQAIINKTTQVSRETRSAKDSFSVFERELQQTARGVDNLRAAYDPMFLASRRLQQGERLLQQALDQGQIELRERDQLLGALRTEYAATTAAQARMARGVNTLTTATRGGAGGMQNFSYQLQDVFTQVGMGVPLMISLGQQAPQILSGFGTVGAMAGVVAAGVLPLSAAVFGLGYNSGKTGEMAKSLEDRLDELASMVDAYRTALTQARADTSDLAKAFGEATELGRVFLALGADKLRVESLEALQTNIDEIVDGFGRLDDTVRDDGRGLASTYFQDAVRRIIRDFGLAANEARLLAERVRELDDADGLGAQALAAEALIDTLINSVGSYEQMNEQTRKLFENIRVAGREALRLDNASDAITFDAATQSASRLANELGRAVSSAIALANQGVGDADRARINYEFRDNPLGRTGALAELEFDSRVGDTSGMAPPVQLQIEDDRRAFIRGRIEAQRYTSALQVWQKEQSRTGGGGGGGGGSSSRADTAHTRSVNAIERAIGSLEGAYARDQAAAERWRAETLAGLDPTKDGYQQFASDVEIIFQDQLAEAYLADLKRRDDWQAGISRGLAEVNDELSTWASVGEDIVGKWSSGLEDAFVEMALTGKTSVADLVDYTLEQFLRLAYQQSVQPAVNGLFDLVGSGIGSLFGGTAGVGQSHSGSEIGRSSLNTTFTGGLRHDERLTVTKLGQRVFTPRQIENGSAVVDALAMAASAGGQGGVVVVQPIINNMSSGAQVETSERADGTLEINVMDRIERGMAARAQQPGSHLNRAIKGLGQSGYGRGKL